MELGGLEPPTSWVRSRTPERGPGRRDAGQPVVAIQPILKSFGASSDGDCSRTTGAGSEIARIDSGRPGVHRTDEPQRSDDADDHDRGRRPGVGGADRRATLKVYPGAPHGVTDTHKEQLGNDLLAFLKSSNRKAHHEHRNNRP